MNYMKWQNYKKNTQTKKTLIYIDHMLLFLLNFLIIILNKLINVVYLVYFFKKYTYSYAALQETVIIAFFLFLTSILYIYVLKKNINNSYMINLLFILFLITNFIFVHYYFKMIFVKILFDIFITKFTKFLYYFIPAEFFICYFLFTYFFNKYSNTLAKRIILLLYAFHLIFLLYYTQCCCYKKISFLVHNILLCAYFSISFYYVTDKCEHDYMFIKFIYIICNIFLYIPSLTESFLSQQHI